MREERGRRREEGGERREERGEGREERRERGGREEKAEGEEEEEGGGRIGGYPGCISDAAIHPPVPCPLLISPYKYSLSHLDARP